MGRERRLCSNTRREIGIVAVVCLSLLFTASADNDDTSFAFSHSLANFTEEEIRCSGSASLTPKESLFSAMCLTPPAEGLKESVVGRCIYGRAIKFSDGPFFSTAFSFNFQTARVSQPGEGFVFMISRVADYEPRPEDEGGGYMGWLNPESNGKVTGLNFGVEFDIKQTKEFKDPPGAHVGINLDSMTSVNFTEVANVYTTNSQILTHAWIDYDAEKVEVRLSLKPVKPCRADLTHYVNLSVLLSEPRFVGFSASTGPGNSSLSQPTIYDWAFSSNAGDDGRLHVWNASGDGKPYCAAESHLAWGWIFSICIACVATGVSIFAMAFLYRRYRMKRSSGVNTVDEELDNLQLGPVIFSYKELSVATNGFHADRVVGRGGFGVVYKGIITKTESSSGNLEDNIVAVKRILRSSQKDFLHEVKVIGCLHHENLVRLLGWSHQKGEFYVVYEYMPNGNLQELLLHRQTAPGVTPSPVSWEMRVRIVNGVAAALAYLHDGVPDHRVLHRDVKSSNVLLDKDYNARLGDFGLSRSYERSETHHNTIIAGSLGYLAPECVITGNFTDKSDVYSFGALTIEIASGKRPPDRRLPGEQGLVNWVRMLEKEGNLLAAADPELGGEGGYDVQQMITMLTVGLSCCNPDATRRPTMRQVQGYLLGEIPLSLLPPLPSSGWNMVDATGLSSSVSMSNDKTSLMGDTEVSDQPTRNSSSISIPPLRSRNSPSERPTSAAPSTPQITR